MRFQALQLRFPCLQNHVGLQRNSPCFIALIQKSDLARHMKKVARMRPLTALAVAALAGCTGDIATGIRPPGSPAPGSEEAPPVVVALAAPQVRVLSATEYRNTVRDLLGLTTSSHLTQSDWTAGFDNGAGILIDDNLLAALVDEAEALGTQYVATRAAADFPCFTAAAPSDACMKTVIEQLGRRAFRRPLTFAQRDELFAFFKATGAQTLVARLLTSPQFLYRSEVGHAAVGADRYALDDFEKASLISYTLTGTMPDEPLLADAEANRLDEPTVRAHIRRLWATPRARERLGDFFRQWLKVTRLDEMARRPEDYPKLLTPALGASLKAEFDAFVGAVVFDGPGTLGSLFTESFTIADQNTAPLYGLTTPSTAPLRLALDPKQRRGVLTLASTMAAIASASDPSKDRPVLRGLMVKEQLLCEEVGPPSNVNTAAAASTAMQLPSFDQLTTREQYEAMMQRGDECRSCHRQFMPLGFTLGAYDALGRHRTEQRGRPVDTAVSDVPFGPGQIGSFADGTELATALGVSRSTADCLSRNLAGFTTGAARNEHTDTLSASVLQKLGSGPVAIARFVEETLASGALYQRKGVAYAEPPPDLPPPPPPVMRAVLLASGVTVNPDAPVTSPDGAFRLLYQSDGNLVLYRVSGGAVWASGTQGTSAGKTSMQGDGNLVVYDRGNVARFNTGTNGNPGAQLLIDAAGGLAVVAPDGKILWTPGGMP